MNLARVLALHFLLIAAIFVCAPPPSRAAEFATADPEAADPEAGTRGVVLTTVEGTRIEEIPVTFLGTQKNALGPGYDLHLVMLEGEIADRVGVAAGMSGSPVFVDGRLVGALAYRVGTIPREPVAGVTPARDVLAAAISPPPGNSPAEEMASPIATPVQIGGLVGPVREWLAPRLRELGFTPVLGGGGGAAETVAAALRPGSPLGVGLVRGDLEIGATGTVTWIDGERLFAFGHSFFGDGRAEMPMVSAEVIHTLADAAGSFKLARYGAEVGVITEDRLSSVVGRTGGVARMIPVTVKVRGASYGERDFRFEVARHATLSPLLSSVAVANSLMLDLGHDRQATMLARGRVRLEGLPQLELDLAHAGAGLADPALAIAADLQQTISALWLNRFTAPRVESIELEVQVRPEVRRYRIEGLRYDRGPLRPGQRFEFECVMSRYRGESVTRTLQVRLPDSFAGMDSLLLAVGPPDQIERALGRPIEESVSSAADLETMVRALSRRRGAQRLTAVLYRRAGTVVSRGAEYGALPPTAERLLASRSSGGAAQRSPVSLLAREELEMDGPVEGGLAVRLRIDPNLGLDGEE